MTIIGCIGDTTLIDPRQFEIDTCVDKVMHVQEPYKLANRAFHPEDSIIDVSGVKIGGEHLGPVSYTHLDPHCVNQFGQLTLRPSQSCVRIGWRTFGRDR